MQVLNWFVLWWLYFRGRIHDVQTEALVDAVQIDRAALVKAGLVTVLVLAGFLAGFPPPLVAAVGAAIMLITRTRDPHLVYEKVDWGLPVFFAGLFLIAGGAESAGLTERLLGFGERFNLQGLGVFTSVTAILSNLVSNVPAVMLLKSLVTRKPTLMSCQSSHSIPFGARVNASATPGRTTLVRRAWGKWIADSNLLEPEEVHTSQEIGGRHT
jgi:Na+/H+ antiporter NhaD/arsenite permease-like protein